MRFIRALAIVLLAIAPAVAVAGPAEDASAAIDRWAAAYSANDVSAVVNLYTPDAIVLGTANPNMAEGTDAIRSYFGAILPGSGNKVAIKERRVIALSEGVAFGTGFYEFTRMRGGQPVLDPARFTMLLVNRGGTWLIAHQHSSPRPKPPQ